MIRMHQVAVAAVVAISAVSASAADFYVGGSIGSSSVDTEGDSFSDGGITLRVTDKRDTGLKAFVGAQITPNLALEGGYVDLGKVKLSGSVLGTPFTGNIRGTGFFFDVVGQVPVAQNFALFGKLGVLAGKTKVSVSVPGAGSGSDDDSGTDVKFGLGASYSFTKNFSVRGEWERFRFDAYDDNFDADLFSVGFSYKF